SVSVSINAANDVAILAGAVTFQVSAPATTVAGAAVPVTVTAVDASGNAVPGFLGTVGISTSDPQASGPGLSCTFTATDAGTHTVATGVSLLTAGSQTITVTNPFMTSASQTVTVTGAAAHHFTVTAPAATVAGAPVSFTVTALDAYGNLAAGYTGTVRFSSSDMQADLPAAYTFTAADAGVQTFTATLKTVATGLGQRLTATDVA